MAPKRKLYMVGVAQPQAWAVGVRNSPVVDMPAAHEELVGHYVALCANGTYDAAWAQRVDDLCGVRCPRSGAARVSQHAIVAVGRVVGVSSGPEPYGEGRTVCDWYSGPAGLWLAGVVAIKPLRAEAPLVPVELAEEELAEVRARYMSAWAALFLTTELSEEQLLAMPAEDRERLVSEALGRCPAETAQRLRQDFMGA